MLQINARFEPDTEKGGFVVTFSDFPWGDIGARKSCRPTSGAMQST